MSKKKKIHVRIMTLDVDDFFSATIQDIVLRLERIRLNAEEHGYEEVRLTSDDLINSFEYDRKVEVYGSRLETDKEFERRQKRERLVKERRKNRKKKQEEKDRKLFEKLRERFEEKTIEDFKRIREKAVQKGKRIV